MRVDKIKIKGKVWVEKTSEAGSIVRHHGSVDEGRILYSSADEKLWFATDTLFMELSGRYAVVNSGTRMLLGSSPLPDNWNLNPNSVINEKIILLTNDSDNVGDYNSGSWTITGMQTADAHDHDGVLASSSKYSVGKSDISGYIPLYNHIHTITSDGVHQHTFNGTWRPAHYKMVEAEYS